MEPVRDLHAIFAALAEARVRYLVVGGVAVVLHGHPRMTADVDIVLDLAPANAAAALRALASLGYRPRAPVDAMGFADPLTRRGWIEEKGLTVFSLWSSARPATEVDLFVEEPFVFEDVYARSSSLDIGGTSVSLISLEDLIALKRAAGRPKDLEDVLALEAIRREEDPAGS